MALPVVVTPDGVPGPFTVTAMGLPTGVMVTPISLNSNESGQLLFTASASADQGAFAPEVAATTDSKTITVVALSGAQKASTSVQLNISISDPSFAPAPGDINLPVVKIDTSGVAITSRTVDVPGTITITSDDGQVSYLPNSSDADNTATFHVHGHSTALMPKLAYDVKLNTSMDLLATMGLTCPYVTSSGKPTCDKSKSYVLLANYDDKTFLRDWSASALANAIPMGGDYLTSPPGSPTPSGTTQLMPWAPHSLFVALYLNGVYEGNYQLIEKVKVDSHRINISELSETDTSDVTGGYLLEIDHYEDETFVFTTPQDMPIGLVDPDFSPDPEVPEQTDHIENYVDAAENALFSDSFNDPTLGWRAYFDEASAVNFYIVNDLMGNLDGGDMWSSDYLYKGKDNPLLYMGPIWDFDISSGNVNYAAISNPTVPWMQAQSSWYRRLFQDPGFKADVAKQFDLLESNGVFTTWLNSIQQEAIQLEQSQKNNFGRWPMQEELVWPNAEVAGSYQGEVTYLLNYLQLRIAYLDSVLNGKQPTTTTLQTSATAAASGSAVTLTAHVSGGTDPGGAVTFMVNSLVGSTADLDGNDNAIVSASNLPPGSDAITAVYAGDGTNALSESGSTTVLIAAPPVETTTSLAISPTGVQPGTPVTLTAGVVANSGTGTPAGTVVFTAGTLTLGTATLDRTGVAALPNVTLPSGASTVEANYQGSSSFAASSSITESQ